MLENMVESTRSSNLQTIRQKAKYLDLTVDTGAPSRSSTEAPSELKELQLNHSKFTSDVETSFPQGSSRSVKDSPHSPSPTGRLMLSRKQSSSRSKIDTSGQTSRKLSPVRKASSRNKLTLACIDTESDNVEEDAPEAGGTSAMKQVLKKSSSEKNIEGVATPTIRKRPLLVRNNTSSSLRSGKNSPSGKIGGVVSTPSADAFNERINVFGRNFLKQMQLKKANNRVRQEGFERGRKNNTLVINAITRSHYKIAMYSANRSRQKAFVLALEDKIEVTTACQMEDLLSLLTTSTYDLLVPQMTRTHAELLDLMLHLKDRSIRIPVVLIIPAKQDPVQQEELTKCLDLGALGYFTDDVPIELFTERILAQLSHLSSTEKIRQVIKSSAEEKEARALKAQQLENQKKYQEATSKQKRGRITADYESRLSTMLRRQNSSKATERPHSVLGIGLALGNAEEYARASPSSRPKTPESVAGLMYANPSKYQLLTMQQGYRATLKPGANALDRDCIVPDFLYIDPTTSTKSNVQSFVCRGYHQITMEKYETALNWFDKAIASEKQVKLAYLLRGIVLGLIGKFGHAENSFTASLKYDKNFHEAYYNRCLARMYLGKDLAAMRDVEKALTLQHKTDRYLQTRALLFRRLGSFKAAQQDYRALSYHHDVVLSTKNTTGATLHQAFIENKVQGDVYEHLFARPSELTTALRTLPKERTETMLRIMSERLQQIPSLRSIPIQNLQSIARELEYCSIKVGTCLELAIKNPKYLFIVLSGTMAGRQHVEGLGRCYITVSRLTCNSLFGALGASLTRIQALRADEPTEIVYLTSKAYQQVMHPIWLRKQNECYEFLRQLPIFKKVSTHDLTHFTNRAYTQVFQRNACFIKQGEPIHHLYILRKGICSAFQSHGTSFESVTKRKVDNSNSRNLPFHHRSVDLRILDGKVTQGMANVKEDNKPRPSISQVPLEQRNRTKEYVWSNALQELQDDETVHITTFTAPDVMGDTVLLPPSQNQAKVTVRAETFIELLVLDRADLESSSSSSEIAEAIRTHAPVYCQGKELKKKHRHQIQWENHRSKEMLKLSKERWPVQQVNFMPGGISLVVPQNEKSKTLE